MGDVYDELEEAFTIEDRRDLVRAVDVTMEALGATISSDTLRDALAEAVAPSLRVGLRAGGGAPPVHVDELYARVAAATGLPPGVAVELTQMFATWLGERMRPDLRQALRDDLGGDWSSLLADAPPRPASHRPTHRHVPPMPGPLRTLADGAPGSARPLSSSRPPRGQSDSLAASEDPTEDPKAGHTLAGGRPRDPSATDRSLADGEPGARRRSLSRYDD